jgi:hypothetical protein
MKKTYTAKSQRSRLVFDRMLDPQVVDVYG